MSDTKYSVKSGFYDAINHDRLYSADDMNQPYKEIMTEGIDADGFAVTPQSTPDMTINVAAGHAFLGGKWVDSIATTMDVPANTALYGRIDSVILRVDVNSEVREANLIYRTGTPADTPEAPGLIGTTGIYEVRLANIAVAVSATAIAAAQITDKRGGSDCPYADIKLGQLVREQQITDDVTSWLAAHVDPVGSAVVVDDSLSVEGAAADAKTVGDAIYEMLETQASIPVEYTEISNTALYKEGNSYYIIPYSGTTTIKYNLTVGETYYVAFTNPSITWCGESNTSYYGDALSLDPVHHNNSFIFTATKNFLYAYASAKLYRFDINKVKSDISDIEAVDTDQNNQLDAIKTDASMNQYPKASIANAFFSNWDNAWHIMSYTSDIPMEVYELEEGRRYSVKSGTKITLAESNSYFYGNAIDVYNYQTINSGGEIDIVPSYKYLYLKQYGDVEVFDDYGKISSIKMGSAEVTIAGVDSPPSLKALADLVCDGVNDEVEFQTAIGKLAEYGGTIRLAKGTYTFGSYTTTTDGRKRCVYIPNTYISNKYITIIGEGMGNTTIKISNALYESLESSDELDILSAEKFTGEYPQTGLFLKDLSIRIPSNQKKIVCVNYENIGRASMERINVFGYIASYIDYASIPPYAVEGCVGVRMTNGWSLGYINNFISSGTTGFYEGWQVGGEHVVMINCSAIYNVYGYTFGNYDYVNNFCHPITLINCCDERGVNMPKFVKSGRIDPSSGTHYKSIQNIDLIDFNLERGISGNSGVCPGGVYGDNAVCVDDSQFGGRITYTNLGGTGNVANQKFFKTGGINFEVRNVAIPMQGTTNQRNSYVFNDGQVYYDTDLGKMLRFFNGDWYDITGMILS